MNKSLAITAVSALLGAAVTGTVLTNRQNRQITDIAQKNIEYFEKNTELLAKNDSLQNVITAKNNEIVSIKKPIVSDIFHKQMDSIGRVNKKYLNQDFYERTINNAAFLDSISGKLSLGLADSAAQARTNIGKVINVIPEDTLVDIWANSNFYTNKVATNLLKHFGHIR